MTQAADLVLTNAEVHTLTDPDRTAEAVAVRDGDIVRVGSAYEVDFLVGVGTDVLDLGGRVLLPGFIDAHTHLEQVGRSLVYADLSAADTLEDAIELLRERGGDSEGSGGEGDESAGGASDDDWILGFGYDESEWPGGDHPTPADLDRVSEDRPVAAVRVDMHTAAVNTAGLERIRTDHPDGVRTDDDGDPTGVVVEDALGPVWDAVAGTREDTRDLLTAAVDRATELGITGVHDMVRNSHAPRVYRDLAREGDLDVRVTINYWSDHFDALREVGSRTGDGDGMVRTGAIKTFTDGSLGGQTAKLSTAYEDAEGSGEWVVDPEDFRSLVDRADAAGYRVAAHAIGDEAVELALSAFEACDDPAGHRIEHAELASDDHVSRLADSGVVASMQPNFHRWARDGGLYDRRLGEERRRRTNRLGAMADAGVHLAFGSDCMPMDPLYGVEQAVTAPEPEQRVDVTTALRAYTLGSAGASGENERVGTVEPGKRADLVVLDNSPWAVPRESIGGIDVMTTVVDGRVVYNVL